MCIIGITGTLGAGKGTVVKYLEESRWFVHLSARKLFEEILAKQGRPADRDQFHALANDLRGKYGADYIARALYEKALEHHQPVVIESLHTVAEADALHEKGNFTLLAVDAPLEERYDRIVQRWTVTDHVTFEKFVQQQNAELESDDPTHQNLKACIAKADYVLMNTGSIDDLHANIEKILEKIGI